MLLSKRGVCLVNIPIDRRSWLCVGDRVIIVPAQINRRALNRAWVIKWNRANFGNCIPSLAIITPSCLRVDSAIIFFISDSVIAESPAINIVKEEIKSIDRWKVGVEDRNG